MTLSKKKLFEKFMKLQRNESGNVFTLMAVFYAVIIVIAVSVGFTLAAVIGSSVDAAALIPANSSWNNSYNPSIVTGAEIWTTQGAMLSAVVIIAVAAMALIALFALFNTSGGKGKGKGGGM